MDIAFEILPEAPVDIEAGLVLEQIIDFHTPRSVYLLERALEEYQNEKVQWHRSVFNRHTTTPSWVWYADGYYTAAPKEHYASALTDTLSAYMPRAVGYGLLSSSLADTLTQIIEPARCALARQDSSLAAAALDYFARTIRSAPTGDRLADEHPKEYVKTFFAAEATFLSVNFGAPAPVFAATALPAAVTLFAADVEASFSGSAFRIDGSDHTFDGGVCAGGASSGRRRGGDGRFDRGWRAGAGGEVRVARAGRGAGGFGVWASVVVAGGGASGGRGGALRAVRGAGGAGGAGCVRRVQIRLPHPRLIWSSYAAMIRGSVISLHFPVQEGLRTQHLWDLTAKRRYATQRLSSGGRRNSKGYLDDLNGAYVLRMQRTEGR